NTRSTRDWSSDVCSYDLTIKNFHKRHIWLHASRKKKLSSSIQNACLMNIKKQQMQKDLKLHKQRKHIFMLILPRVSVTLREFSVLNCTYPMKAMKIGSIRMLLKRLYFLKREILSRLVKSN